MDTGVILAVDGGASNCRALLCDCRGTVLSYAQGGACNYRNTGLDLAVSRLRDVVQAAIGGRVRLETAAFGLAGVDTRRDQQLLTQSLQGMLREMGLVCDRVIVDNDGMMTLAGSLDQSSGVLLIAGTGAIACGMTVAGEQARAGGWGHFLDAAGSGYAIGKAALQQSMRGYDGREPDSRLAAALLEHLELADPEQLVDWVYSSHFSVERVASLAAVVAAFAAGGDSRAQAILADAVRGLAAMAAAVVRRLRLQDRGFQLLLAGGLLQNLPDFRLQAAELIRNQYPCCRLQETQVPPICGTVLQAWRHRRIERSQLLAALTRQLVSGQVQK
ncbi:MAG: BadF/BadG/BcrA/BcrD ATPase family protein [Sporomusaceae bacterium]|nr:BadF/BadG/BcrA/BcrD ATPase family protein [Sporomusaceae bacterium]